jgi:dihydroxyacetone kinase
LIDYIHGSCAHALSREAGVLVFTINDTGHRLNFAIAVEKAKRMNMKVEVYVCADDCAATHSRIQAKRGVSGSLLLLKVAFFEIVKLCQTLVKV